MLPARLKGEMEKLADAIVTGQDLRADEATEKHADWAEEFLKKYSDVNIENVHEILYKEIGIVFSRVLEDAGVYKRTPEGRRAFRKFIESL